MHTSFRSSKASTRLAALLVLVGFAAAAGARADDYDPQRAGHPVRIIAYVVHPVGVVLDLLIFRPAHWVGSLPGLDEFFGHEPYDD
jgi:hypothetical protein